MKAGKLLGSPGKTGKVYETCNIERDKDTFCNLLETINILSIEGYDFSMQKHVLDKSKFIDSINNSVNIVTKEYYSDTAYDDFIDEVSSINRIYKYFGNKLGHHTTLKNVIVYDNKEIIGVVISHGDEDNTLYKKLYITFQGKCETRFREYALTNELSKREIDLFLKNILETLVILQDKNIAHCDIKFDNIMTNCPYKNENQFKLIDWNLSKLLIFKNIQKFKGIKPYLRGSSPFYYVFHKWIHWSFYIHNYTRDCMLTEKETYKQLVCECVKYAKLCYRHFYEIFNELNDDNTKPKSKKNNEKDIFEKFKFTTDLWSIGLMLYYLAKKHNLPNYIPLCDILCLVEKSPLTGDYIKNAQEVLELMRYSSTLKNTSCGKIHGVGAHGMLIDMCCDIETDNLKQNVLCKHIQHLNRTKSIKTIDLYTPELNKITVKNIDEFIKLFFTKYSNDIAVKYYILDEATARKDMMDDIMNDRTTLNLYNTNQDMLTSCDISFKNDRIIGLSITTNDNKIQYYYFSKRCKKTLDNLDKLTLTDINKIISDVLSSLSILHATEYYHGDIKAQNIMLCPDKSKYIYKIIDWGRLYPINRYDKSYKYGGSMQAGTPLGFYFMIRNKSYGSIPRATAAKMAVLLFEGKLPFRKLKCPFLMNKDLYSKFKLLWKEIKINFINCVINSENDEALFNKFKYTLDTYNFGLTLLYILLLNNIDDNPKIYNKYYITIRKMTVYNNDMITSAKDALFAFQKL